MASGRFGSLLSRLILRAPMALLCFFAVSLPASCQSDRAVLNFGHRSNRNILLALNSDGSRLATGSGDEILVWDIRTGKILWDFRRSKVFCGVQSLAWNPTKSLIAAACADQVLVFDPELGSVVKSYQQPAQQLFWSPDGQKLALLNGNSVRLVQPDSGVILMTLADIGSGARLAAWSRDGRVLAVLAGTTRYNPTERAGTHVIVWDTESARRTNVSPLGLGAGRLLDFSWAAGGAWVTVASDEDGILVLRSDARPLRVPLSALEPGKETVDLLREFKKLPTDEAALSAYRHYGVRAALLSHDAQRIAVQMSYDSSIFLLDPTGTRPSTLIGQLSNPVWSVDDTLVGEATEARGFASFTRASDGLKSSMKIRATNEDAVFATWIDDSRLAVRLGLTLQRFYVLDLAKMELQGRFVFDRSWDSIKTPSIASLHDPESGYSGSLFVGTRPDYDDASRQNKVFLWDATTFEIQLIWSSSRRVDKVQLGPDGKRFVVELDKIYSKEAPTATVASINTEGGRLVWEKMGWQLAGESGNSWSPDGNLVALVHDRKLSIHKSANGDFIKQLDGELGAETVGGVVRWSPDGLYLARSPYSRWDKGGATVWDVSSGRVIRREAFDRLLSWSPDGKFLASDDGANLVIWDPVKGAEIHRLNGFAFMSAAWSPSGRHFAAGDYSNSVRIWDTHSWELLCTIYFLQESPYSPETWLAVRPDGAFTGEGDIGEYLHFVRDRVVLPFPFAYRAHFAQDLQIFNRQ